MDNPKEEAMQPMAEVDTRLEEALEAVLVRYGIPPYGLGAIGMWDRGDLSSDLADAARAAPSPVDAEGYERHLAAVYADLKAIYEAHPEHVVSFAATADGTCRACGQPVHAKASASRCGGPNPTDRCDALGAALYGRIDEAFPPADVERWLAAWPAPDFLEWGTDGGGIPGDGSVRAWIAETLQHDAIDRMLGWENLIPADPATTRPADRAKETAGGS